MKKLLEKAKLNRSFYSAIGLLLIVIVSSVGIKEFMTISNVTTLFRQAATLLVLSTGLTAVILTGNIDLSVGATAGLVGCICAQFLRIGTPVPLVLLIGIGIGIIVGSFNAFLVGIAKLPSFIATFGSNWVISGLSIIVMNGAVVFGLPENFTWFGVGYIGPVPVVAIIAIIVVSIVYFILQKTTFGRDVYATGANREAARYSAVPVSKTLFIVFIMSAITAAIAGLLITARLNAADSTMGDAYGLQTVAAVVIGGTSMLGGEGGISGTIIGAMLLTIIINVMNLLGITSFAQPLIVGIVIISMVLFDAYTRKIESNKIKEIIKSVN